MRDHLFLTTFKHDYTHRGAFSSLTIITTSNLTLFRHAVRNISRISTMPYDKEKKKFNVKVPAPSLAALRMRVSQSSSMSCHGIWMIMKKKSEILPTPLTPPSRSTLRHLALRWSNRERERSGGVRREGEKGGEGRAGHRERRRPQNVPTLLHHSHIRGIS